MSKKYLIGFTLVELLVTMTIIVMMALVTIPSFNKHQALIELQNKTDEIKADIDEMQIKTMNAGQGVTRYYVKVTAATSGKVEFYNNSSNSPYKTVNLTSSQTLSKSAGISGDYLVCDKGKSYCCNVSGATDACTTADAMNSTDFFTIANTSKTTTFKISAYPFRVITTTN